MDLKIWIAFNFKKHPFTGFCTIVPAFLTKQRRRLKHSETLSHRNKTQQKPTGSGFYMFFTASLNTNLVSCPSNLRWMAAQNDCLIFMVFTKQTNRAFPVCPLPKWSVTRFQQIHHPKKTRWSNLRFSSAMVVFSVSVGGRGGPWCCAHFFGINLMEGIMTIAR